MAKFLDVLASDRPTPGGGGAAAIATALGASLTAMAARRSLDYIPDAPAIANHADELRTRALELAAEDSEAYEAVLRAGGRRAEALSAAADPPLAVAEAALQVANLAAALARSGNPNLKGDALTAAYLAEAAAKAAATLVEINLRGAGVSDGRLRRATETRAAATEALQRRPANPAP